MHVEHTHHFVTCDIRSQYCYYIVVEHESGNWVNCICTSSSIRGRVVFLPMTWSNFPPLRPIDCKRASHLGVFVFLVHDIICVCILMISVSRVGCNWNYIFVETGNVQATLVRRANHFNELQMIAAFKTMTWQSYEILLALKIRNCHWLRWMASKISPHDLFPIAIKHCSNDTHQ